MFRGLVALLLLGCSPTGETGAPSGSDSGGTGGSEAGASGDGGMGPVAGTGGTSEAGTAGTGGEPDLCQAGDERLCSCAPGYGGKQTCSDFGWNLCVCPDWPPAGGTGGSGGSGGTGGDSGGSPSVGLGSSCTTGTDDCVGLVTPPGVTPICVQSDGLEGGEPRPGHCTWPCFGASATCTERGGECRAVGELTSHCVAWETGL